MLGDYFNSAEKEKLESFGEKQAAPIPGLSNKGPAGSEQNLSNIHLNIPQPQKHHYPLHSSLFVSSSQSAFSSRHSSNAYNPKGPSDPAVPGLQWLPNWSYQSSQAPPYYTNGPTGSSHDQGKLGAGQPERPSSPKNDNESRSVALLKRNEDRPDRYNILEYYRAPAKHVNPELLPPPQHPFSKEPSQQMYYRHLTGDLAQLQHSAWNQSLQVSKEYQGKAFCLVES
jgi:hypothetical protein